MKLHVNSQAVTHWGARGHNQLNSSAAQLAETESEHPGFTSGRKVDAVSKHDRKLRKFIELLDLGRDPTLNAIKAALERRRRSHIEIVELNSLAGSSVCGLWLAYEDRDVVVHAPVKSAWHRQQIILHEFAHMLLSHDERATPLTDLNTFGIIDTPKTALGRSSFNDEDEADAENLADLLAQKIANRRSPHDGDPTGFSEVFG